MFINNEEINIDESSKIGLGRSSYVYLYNKKAVKIYNDYGEKTNELYNYRLAKLKSLKLNHFILPKEIVYDESSNIIGYTMDYIKGCDGKIINYLDFNFFKKNILEIYKEALILSKNNILVYDVFSANVIINYKSIYIIDTDGFLFNSYKGADINEEVLFSLNILIGKLLNITPNKKNSNIYEVLKYTNYKRIKTVSDFSKKLTK